MTTTQTARLGVTQTPFGFTREGAPASLFSLTNARGALVKITNVGGIITEIHMPDKHGQFADVTLGFDSLAPYYTESPYFGAIIGRYGNRLARGRFVVDGVSYQLARNDGNNHLHGGVLGFDKALWTAEPFVTEAAAGLKLSYFSVDGDQGYPGNLQVTVTYELSNDNAITVKYHAVTDKTTPVNLTHHAYFNLAGQGDILGHEMMINADRITAINNEAIPTGELAPVEGTPFDFRTPSTIGARIAEQDQQLINGRGYDHNYVLNKPAPKALSLAARVREATSGRVLEVYTQEPGVQFYSGNYLDGSIMGKNGVRYERRHGFCLEPQHFPDSPNQPKFPNTILRPGEVYSSEMSYRFLVEA